MLVIYNGTIFSDTKKRAIDLHNNIDKSQMHFAKWKISDPKCCELYNFILVNL